MDWTGKRVLVTTDTTRRGVFAGTLESRNGDGYGDGSGDGYGGKRNA